MQHWVSNSTTLAVHNGGVRMQEYFHKSINFGQSKWLIGDLSSQQGGVWMQEYFHKSINFGQSKWLIGDLSSQQGGVRGVPQKKDNIFI